MTVPVLAGRSKTQYAYEVLRDRIVGGRYGPGSRLVFDRIARELGVSPVPVREAVRRLQAEGWVVFEPNVGAQVADFAQDEYRHTMEALALLEGHAVATARLTNAILDRAELLNAMMRETLAVFDPLGFTRLNREFHLLLCDRSPNPRLRDLITKEWARLDLSRRSTFSLVPGRARESVEEHDELLRLLRAGAPAEVVERFARDHKLNTLRAVDSKSAAPLPGESTP
ncbi:GntR family transcriptional regulator [Saccharothrix violaceirubra]|uniref:DNA-binding GntR family transcriptional regulator n=1 Tax=Saccharothrix violaceirubra TaxID=413306 RepID=A0A7W7T2A1_9PSEU|nr:GntR family transcriptional regulator [Saccharothrix violaceirubra]MBB4965249.1 DNA-binding GntR family transcriptional regulator [Saccharothrix violaceirubra]